MTEVDLDKVKTGDRLIVEVPVRVGEASGNIYLGRGEGFTHEGTLVDRLTEGDEGFKVLAHKPKFDEPKGIGALAFIPQWMEDAVKVSHLRWFLRGEFYSWGELTDKYEVGGVAEGPTYE